MSECEEKTDLALPTARQTVRGDAVASDLSKYSLTIGEASSLMVEQRCKFASNRKVQRMCRDGVIDCFKLSTTRGGQPVSEWLVNESSLLRHVEENEIKWDAGVPVSPAASGNASFEIGGAPNPSGAAILPRRDDQSVDLSPNVVAMPDVSGDAKVDAIGHAKAAIDAETPGNAMAPPESDGNATDEPIGETRTLASVLIENARLTAELEGTRDLIGEVRDDKEFLRDELREARAGRKDVTAIAQRMLETLESIAVGGKLIRPAQGQSGGSPDPVSKLIVQSEPASTHRVETPAPQSQFPTQPLHQAEPQSQSQAVAQAKAQAQDDFQPSSHPQSHNSVPHPHHGDNGPSAMDRFRI